MSKISLDLKTLFADDFLLPPAAGELLSQLAKHIEYNDLDKGPLVGRRYDIVSTTTLDAIGLSGYKVEGMGINKIRLLVIHVVKTEAEASGTVALASTSMGLSSGVITLTENAQVAALNVGDVIHSYIAFSATGKNPAVDDLVVTIENRVGFKVEALIVGDWND